MKCLFYILLLSLIFLLSTLSFSSAQQVNEKNALKWYHLGEEALRRGKFYLKEGKAILNRTFVLNKITTPQLRKKLHQSRIPLSYFLYILKEEFNASYYLDFQYLDEILDIRANKNLEFAKMAFSEAINSDPELVDAYFRQAETLLEMGSFENALQVFKEGERLGFDRLSLTDETPEQIKEIAKQAQNGLERKKESLGAGSVAFFFETDEILKNYFRFHTKLEFFKESNSPASSKDFLFYFLPPGPEIEFVREAAGDTLTEKSFNLPVGKHICFFDICQVEIAKAEQSSFQLILYENGDSIPLHPEFDIKPADNAEPAILLSQNHSPYPPLCTGRMKGFLPNLVLKRDKTYILRLEPTEDWDIASPEIAEATPPLSQIKEEQEEQPVPPDQLTSLPSEIAEAEVTPPPQVEKEQQKEQPFISPEEEISEPKKGSKMTVLGGIGLAIFFLLSLR